MPLTAWQERLKLHLEGDQLQAKGGKFNVERDQIYAEANALWVEAIYKTNGNTTRDWKKRGGVWDCYLASGEIFLGDEPMIEVHGAIEKVSEDSSYPRYDRSWLW